MISETIRDFGNLCIRPSLEMRLKDILPKTFAEPFAAVMLVMYLNVKGGQGTRQRELLTIDPRRIE